MTSGAECRYEEATVAEAAERLAEAADGALAVCDAVDER
jgi:hypothetical protein